MRDRLVHLVAADPNRARDRRSRRARSPPSRWCRRRRRRPSARPAPRSSSPAPIAAAIGSSIRCTRRAPAASEASSTARFSTSVTPDGAHTISRGWADPAVDHLADEVAQHLLGDLEVGDHAVAQRARGGDRRRRAADHPLGVGADGVDLAGVDVGRDHRRLGDDDPAAADVDERVGGARDRSPCRAPRARARGGVVELSRREPSLRKRITERVSDAAVVGTPAKGHAAAATRGAVYAADDRSAPIPLAGELARVLRDRLADVQRGGDDPVLLVRVGDRVALARGGALGPPDVAELQVLGQDLQQPRATCGRARPCCAAPPGPRRPPRRFG